MREGDHIYLQGIVWEVYHIDEVFYAGADPRGGVYLRELDRPENRRYVSFAQLELLEWTPI